MKVSHCPSSEAWTGFPTGIPESRKISLFSGGACSVCEKDSKQLTFCSLEGLILVLLEVPHNPVFLDHSGMQMLNNSESWSELLQRMEHSNDRDTMMNEVLQPCRVSTARSWDYLDCFRQALGRTAAKEGGFVQEQFLLLAAV